MQQNRNTQGLRRGNPPPDGGWPGVGRPANAVKKSRREWEAQLQAECGDTALKNIRQAVEEGDKRMSLWVAEAIHGQAQARIVNQIADPDALKTIIRILVDMFELTPDQVAALWQRCSVELGLSEPE